MNDFPPADDALLQVRDLTQTFDVGGGQHVQAVSGVNFDMFPGETLGLVGESGCGKSTTSRAIMQLSAPTSGSVHFDGRDLTQLSSLELRRTRTQLQMIFQDPVSSLNPRRSVEQIIAEPMATWSRGTKRERRAKAWELMEAVGLDGSLVGSRRRPDFFGGQCQRISIARALALEPRRLICDAVSALDVSAQAQILNLLQETKQRFDLTMIFVAHDLAVVKRVSDRVAVMSGQDRGGLVGGRPVPRTSSPLHEGAPDVHPAAGSQCPAVRRRAADRGAALSDRISERVSVQDTLPARRAGLRRRRARADRHRRPTPGRLPLPARRDDRRGTTVWALERC